MGIMRLMKELGIFLTVRLLRPLLITCWVLLLQHLRAFSLVKYLKKSPKEKHGFGEDYLVSLLWWKLFV